MSGELAKRGGCRSARFLLEQMNTSVVEGRRMRFRDADPTSAFLGVSRRLDVGCGGGAFKYLWEECRGPFGVQIGAVVRGVGAQSGAMV